MTQKIYKYDLDSFFRQIYELQMQNLAGVIIDLIAK